MKLTTPTKTWARMLTLAALLSCSAVAVTDAADSPMATRILKLHDAAQAGTDLGRMRLKYLVGCALPADTVVEVEVEVDHQTYRFPGSLALAPAWSQRGLTVEEEQLVSSCILARTNYFGIPVLLLLRAAPGNSFAALQPSPDEMPGYRYFEAAFFGNVFRADHPSYVCVGDPADANRTRTLEALKRVCSLPPEAAAPGAPSRCGFEIVGPCSDQPFVQKGVDYSQQAIEVFLAAPADPPL